MLAILTNIINDIIINIVSLSQKSLSALMLNSETPLSTSPGIASFQLF